jgi:hypothetical protein
MRQGLKFVVTLCSILLLSGCDVLNHYDISEDAINQSLKKHSQIEKNLGVSGLFTVTFSLNQLKTHIGQDKLGFINLNGNGKILLTTFLGDQTLDFQLQVSARPTFNKQQSSIFLQDFTISELAVQPAKLTKTVDNLNPLINHALSDYFAQHPAYTLSSEHGLREAVIKYFVRDLVVQPGALVIKLGV